MGDAYRTRRQANPPGDPTRALPLGQDRDRPPHDPQPTLQPRSQHPEVHLTCHQNERQLSVKISPVTPMAHIMRID